MITRMMVQLLCFQLQDGVSSTQQRKHLKIKMVLSKRQRKSKIQLVPATSFCLPMKDWKNVQRSERSALSITLSIVSFSFLPLVIPSVVTILNATDASPHWVGSTERGYLTKEPTSSLKNRHRQGAPKEVAEMATFCCRSCVCFATLRSSKWITWDRDWRKLN